jgi:mannose-6-phosphate isomerase-like protein (cupin superfamily)
MRKALSMAALAAAVATAGAAAGDTQVFQGDITNMTKENADFRRVLFTGKNLQVVAMQLRPGEDIGEEVHPVDQCFFVVEGTAQTTVAGSAGTLESGGVLCVPGGTRHDVKNVGRDNLKLFTTYAPPQHPPGTVHRTKADAERAEAARH